MTHTLREVFNLKYLCIFHQKGSTDFLSSSIGPKIFDLICLFYANLTYSGNLLMWWNRKADLAFKSFPHRVEDPNNVNYQLSEFHTGQLGQILFLDQIWIKIEMSVADDCIYSPTYFTVEHCSLHDSSVHPPSSIIFFKIRTNNLYLLTIWIFFLFYILEQYRQTTIWWWR